MAATPTELLVTVAPGIGSFTGKNNFKQRAAVAREVVQNWTVQCGTANLVRPFPPGSRD